MSSAAVNVTGVVNAAGAAAASVLLRAAFLLGAMVDWETSYV